MIEWAEESWNPITGCTPISEGCQNCYAKRMAQRLKGRFGYPKDEPFRVTFHRDKLDQPLRWKRPRQIFVGSMGDLFHEKVTWTQRDLVMQSIVEADHHVYLFLTKRPQNMLEFFQSYEDWESKQFPFIWLGVTAENQQRADERIPILLQIPAAKRFVSIEPMLGPVDLDKTCPGKSVDNGWYWRSDLDWIICGSESGPKRRQAKIQWFRDLKNQCVDEGIPFFLKQANGYINGKSTVVKLPELDGRQWIERP